MRHFVVAAALLVANPALAETPQLRCFTGDTVDVTTLPRHSEKMWHETKVRGSTPDQATAVWFRLPPGTAVGVFVSYVINGVEWDWISGEVSDGAIVTGWAERSRLKCE